MTERVCVMLHKQNYERLNAIKEQLEEILHKKLSMDEVVNVILTVKGIDQQLTDMLLEPSVRM
jgi:CRISPR/Cas system-associated protein Cas10 (large subunit of type III CRISPR-Cas system)